MTQQSTGAERAARAAQRKARDEQAERLTGIARDILQHVQATPDVSVTVIVMPVAPDLPPAYGMATRTPGQFLLYGLLELAMRITDALARRALAVKA